MEMRDVPGFEERYSVTDDGRVWSKRYRRWLSAQTNHSGYLKVGLHWGDRHEKKFVHRIVCEAFHGKPPTPQYQVDHINGDHKDNRAENLRWVTTDENLKYAADIGIGRGRRPVIGCNAEGDIIRFESISIAQRNGFSNIMRCLKNPGTTCRGYFFVYEEDWHGEDPLVFYVKVLQRHRPLRKRGRRPAR